MEIHIKYKLEMQIIEGVSIPDREDYQRSGTKPVREDRRSGGSSRRSGRGRNAGGGSSSRGIRGNSSGRRRPR